MPGMNLANKNHCDFSLFAIPKRSNIQLAIKSTIMNRKRNQMGITGFNLTGRQLIKSQMLYQSN